MESMPKTCANEDSTIFLQLSSYRCGWLLQHAHAVTDHVPLMLHSGPGGAGGAGGGGGGAGGGGGGGGGGVGAGGGPGPSSGSEQTQEDQTHRGTRSFVGHGCRSTHTTVVFTPTGHAWARGRG